MSDLILELKSQLETQQSDLAEKIRRSENDLISLKETYLKVVGALEFVGVFKEKSDAETREALTTVGLAD
jgi:hypothetical protein